MNALAIHEHEKLEILEAKIAAGLQTFVEVGTALFEIRDNRLYRVTHATFEQYLADRWPQISRRRAYQLMDAAQAVENVNHGTQVLPTTERQARPLTRLEPEIQPIAWGEAVATAPNGKVTAAHVEAIVRRFVAPVAPDEDDELLDEVAGEETGYDWTEDEPFHAAASSNGAAAPQPEYDSNEWYTPREFIEAARDVMGYIDLDPASCDEAQQHINALNYYTKEDDGLAQQWHGRVWLNPPYGDPLPWVEKLTSSFMAGTVTAALLLVNTANSPQWSRLLWRGPYKVCLLDRRVRFWRPDRADAKGTDRDQMIWYLGDDPEKFYAAFSPYGAIR